jgi:hypothetical protein
MGDLPKGFKCKSCGTFHEFSMWVYAHWRDILTHNCECGATHSIRIGKARLWKHSEPMKRRPRK